VAVKHRRKRTEDPKDRTVPVCISIGAHTAEGMKAQADKLGVSVSYLFEHVAKAYLRTRNYLTNS